MSRWAIVIGIDNYRDERFRLGGAVRDAVAFGQWVTSPGGGRVPPTNCRLLLGRQASGPGLTEDFEPGIEESEPTRDNIVEALIDVVARAEADGGAEQLYFYFSGHGITAELAGREESALVLPGFETQHPAQSLAVRSLAEHLETTRFDDQFFFIDACRKPPSERQVQIGAWPVPRRRDPGQLPVQQFILYATSPGLTAVEVGWPDESVGAFSEVLMKGLAGDEKAKAWSWERNCYEVRWERLATYINQLMRAKRHAAASSHDPPPGGWPIQIPQDAGSRGVAGRDRDACLATYQRGRFGDVELELELKADPPIKEAELTVLDAIGTPVVRALRVAEGAVTVTLPPRTYAARAITTDGRVGSVKAPIELYDKLTDEIQLRTDDGPPRPMPGTGTQSLGTIEVHSHDPLSTAEISDEAGCTIAIRRGGEEYQASPGFYRVRHLRPERVLDNEPAAAAPAIDGDEPREETFVVLSGGDRKPVWLGARPPDPFVVQLAASLGGGAEDNCVMPYSGAEPMAWAQPSTVLAAGIGGALTGEVSLEGLGKSLPDLTAVHGGGIALFAVSENGDPEGLTGLATRVWPRGAGIPARSERRVLEPSGQAVAAAVTPVGDAIPHWMSIEQGESATVLTLPLLPNRLAVVIAQIDRARTRLYQFHPHVVQKDIDHPCHEDNYESSSSRRLRRLEYLERQLLGGALDSARPLAEELAAGAYDDPFAGLLAGYVLLRLGLHQQLDPLISAIIDAAPTMSDAYILRGEREARAGRIEASNQAFAEAVNAGIPAFGEGLTRLVEGLRASAFYHPRGALVRHIFRRHIRGTMWAAFAPTRPLHEGELVISGADIGFEG